MTVPGREVFEEDDFEQEEDDDDDDHQASINSQTVLVVVEHAYPEEVQPTLLPIADMHINCRVVVRPLRCFSQIST